MADAPAIYDLGLMTGPEAEAALADIRCVLIPVGSCEQHGPNIALSSDAGQAAAYSRLIAERMHPMLAVAPTINYGISEHHMRFVCTTTLSPDTFMNVCIEVALGFSRHGLGRFMFMNGHGGNTAALSLVCDSLLEHHGLQAAHVVVGSLGAREEAEKLYQGRDVGHACEFEVSSTMYLCPELVRESALAPGDEVANTVRHTRGLNSLIYRAYYWEDRTRNGCLGDAKAGASREAGASITQRGLQMLEEFFTDFCQLPVPAHETSDVT